MPPIKILVVEDEQLIADDLRETLEDLGYQVPGLAATGEDAIRQAEQLRPDLVLMDIRLRGAIDGIAASAQIQSTLQIPVVYLTANADRATLERVKGTHPYGYILKPFNETTLSTTIEIAVARHQAESQVHTALADAEATLHQVESQTEAKSKYFSMASHEFRNPLATIQFVTDFLQQYSDQLSEEKKQRYLERIRSATESLNGLLEDILTLERVGSGIQFTPAWVDLATSYRELVDAFQFSVGDRYRLKLVIDGECNAVWVDEKLLWHLLNNLLSNAVKYSPDGSEILIQLDCRSNPLCLQVKDQGIGIPAEALPQLFEPFQRASNVKEIAGTGLGLAIAKQCVDLHSGSITIESQVGQGTTFIITLPCGAESL